MAGEKHGACQRVEGNWAGFGPLQVLLTGARISLPPSWQFVFFSELVVISPTAFWVLVSLGFGIGNQS